MAEEKIEDLKRELEELKKQLKDTKQGVSDLVDQGGKINGMASDFDSFNRSVRATNAEMGNLIDSFAKATGIKLGDIGGAFSGLTKALFGSNSSANDFTSTMEDLATVVTRVLGPEIGGVFRGIGQLAPAFDSATATTKLFQQDLISLGSTFGTSFDQIIGKSEEYQKTIIESNFYTFEGDKAVRQAASRLRDFGVTIDETMKRISVGGVSMNLLKEGFLLSSATGLKSEDVFKMLGAAARTMGYSVEEANKPIVALSNLARATGLPITELTKETFGTVQQMSRLGLTVDGLSPVIKRFADTLGPAFKGLAIDEVNRLMKGLEGQINTTNAAFMAMRGGLATPGASAVSAQLAFEDAFKDPMEIMKSLATTLSGVTGGRIIKFEEARANPALENQFKIQRDLLMQLTGNRDPQSQRTMLNVLDAIQSGKSLTSEQQSSLQDLLKDGQTKQNEMANIQQQFTRLTVGLHTQSNLLLGNILNRLVPPQAIGEVAREGANILQPAADIVIRQADKYAGMIEQMLGTGIGKALPGPGLQTGPTITGLPSPNSEQMLQGLYQTRPRAGTAVPPAPTTEPGKMTQTNMPAGTSTLQNVVITVQADANDTSQWLARQIKAVVDNTNAGGSRY